jgi:hypothetical protein
MFSQMNLDSFANTMKELSIKDNDTVQKLKAKHKIME